MNEFKFQFVNFLLLGLLVFGMYWAFTSIDNGVTYGVKDIVEETQEETSSLEDEEATIFEEQDAEVNSTSEEISYEVSSTVESQSNNNEHAELLTKLQGLIDDDIYMKEGSRGTRVGTVQKFLNIYFDTSSSVDNQYGPGTKSSVRKFQEKEGLDADGLAGPASYKKMIEILKK